MWRFAKALMSGTPKAGLRLLALLVLVPLTLAALVAHCGGDDSLRRATDGE